jgi:hypothetical protein
MRYEMDKLRVAKQEAESKAAGVNLEAMQHEGLVVQQIQKKVGLCV